MTYRMTVCSLALALASCTDSSAPSQPAAPLPPAPTPGAASDGAQVAAADSAPEPPAIDEAPAEVPSARPAAEAEPEALTGSLHVIARSRMWAMVHRLVDGSVMVTSGPQVLPVDDKGELTYDPKMLRGLRSVRGVGSDEVDYDGVFGWGAFALGGRWPDAVYMSLDVVSTYRGEGGVPEVYRWDGQAWVTIKTATPKYYWYPAEVHPWVDGSLLARRVYIPDYDAYDESDGDPTDKEIKATDLAIAKAKKIIVIRGAPKAPSMPAPPVTFASLPSGEVFVVDGSEPPNLHRIDAGGVVHTTALPASGYQVRGVLAVGPERAWIHGVKYVGEESAPWLVRVEGDTATEAEAPPCKEMGLSSFSALPSGAQWATCGDDTDDPQNFEADKFGLWYRPAGGAWTQRTLPEGITAPRRVVARAEDDVWVAADWSKGGAIVHSRPRDEVLELPGIAQVGRQIFEWSDPEPIDGCLFPYVPLRTPPADAEQIKAKLDGPLSGRKPEQKVLLVRSKYRDVMQLGLQMVIPDDPKEVNKVAAAARKALGKEEVGTPHCWFAGDEGDAVIARWGGVVR